MRWQYVSRIIGILLIFLGFSMVFPMVCSLIYRDGTQMALLISMGITIAAGGLLYMVARKTAIEYISQREGMAIHFPEQDA